MSHHVSFTEAFDLGAPFAIADLGMPAEMDDALRSALNEHPDAVAITAEVEQAITAQLREHGVNTETGEWRGDWSAETIVRDVLRRHRITLPGEDPAPAAPPTAPGELADPVLLCVACNSPDVEEESYGLRCLACGYVHPPNS